MTDAQLVANETRVRRQLKDTDDEFEDALNTLAKHFTPLNYTQRAAPLQQQTVDELFADLIRPHHLRNIE